MPASRGHSTGPAVHLDELAFAEDISHATAAGRRVAVDARRELERDGVEVGKLLRCQAQGRDGTRLERCVSCICRRRAASGEWVVEITRDANSAGLVLAYLAFGVGHPGKPWQPSAYQVAHQRLQPGE